jgi:signal transduction histidine kinase
MRDSIKELVEVIDATGKIKITLDTEDIEDVDVHEDLHLAIYRILQEHLTNILKHADASTVKVKLYLIDNELLLKVKDNGKGFDTSNRYEGIGITNMLSRAESLGGILQINSKPAAGCELFGRFPIGQM